VLRERERAEPRDDERVAVVDIPGTVQRRRRAGQVRGVGRLAPALEVSEAEERERLDVPRARPCRLLESDEVGRGGRGVAGQRRVDGRRRVAHRDIPAGRAGRDLAALREDAAQEGAEHSGAGDEAEYEETGARGHPSVVRRSTASGSVPAGALRRAGRHRAFQGF
jgi:hypothetical protein